MPRTLAAAESIDEGASPSLGPGGFVGRCRLVVPLCLGWWSRSRDVPRQRVLDRLAARRQHFLEAGGEPARGVVLAIDHQRATGEQVRAEIVGPLERDPG